MSLQKFSLDPVARISLGLVALLVSLLMAVDLVFGLVPDRSDMAREVRQQISESLAVQAATLLQAEGLTVHIGLSFGDETNMEGLMVVVAHRPSA